VVAGMTARKFADLGAVMAAKAGSSEQLEVVSAASSDLVPPPDNSSSDGHWSAWLYQRFPGDWQDNADALGLSRTTAWRQAQRFCQQHGVKWPLSRHFGERLVVREVIRGAR